MLSVKAIYEIEFPKPKLSDFSQDEAYFYLRDSEGPRKIGFHDYGEIYRVPGLYEQTFYDRLKCISPAKVTSILECSVR